jgi:hypothetical protein
MTAACMETRIAALRTLKRGDIVVSDTGKGMVYVGIVSRDVSPGESFIDLTSEVRLWKGDALAFGTRATTSLKECSEYPGLRIFRASEGVL